MDGELLTTLELPGGVLTVRRGLGSGLTRRADDPDGIVWAVGVPTRRGYPFDAHDDFGRDMASGAFDWSDIKVSEMLLLPSGRLLVLERGSATTKLYLMTLDPDRRVADGHLAIATRPMLEERSASGTAPRALTKELVLSTEDLPEIDPDLEGMEMLSPSTLLLVNDNDFGVEGVRTRFWRVELGRELD